MPADGILDSLVRLYADGAGPALAAVLPPALALAGSLFALQIGWDLVMWALFDSEHFFAKAVRKGAIFLVIYGLLSAAPFWLPALLEGFEALGERVTGLRGLSPSGIFGQGLDLAFTFFNSWTKVLSTLFPAAGLLRELSMLLLIVAFGLVALQLARVLIEASFALGGLVFFFAFAGHRLTFGLAEGYLRYLLDLGVRIYVLFLVVAVGRDLGRTWEAQLRGLALLDVRLHFAILVGAALFAVLAWTLPREIASRIAGGFSLAGHNPLRDSHG